MLKKLIASNLAPTFFYYLNSQRKDMRVASIYLSIFSKESKKTHFLKCQNNPIKSCQINSGLEI